MLRVAGLSKSYGDIVALNGVDLSIEPGQIMGLLGPNGAGKTTLVSIVAGLRRADSGSVRVGDLDALADPVATGRLIGLAPQELGIYPLLTVRENLLYYGELADLRGGGLRARIDEVVDALDLARLVDRPCRFLSGGEKRRVHTAMALMHRPPLLLLDEPTTGVDVRTRTRVLEVVRGLAADGSAVCYSTHYLPEVESLGASVAILEDGRILVHGEVDELIRKHGECAVELTFEGEAPSVAAGRRTERVDGMLRIYSDRPGADAAEALVRLGHHVERLRAVEIVTPSLEGVFLALTGRRYSELAETDGEADVVPA